MKRSVVTVAVLLFLAACSSDETPKTPATSDAGDAGTSTPDSATSSPTDAGSDTGTPVDGDAGIGQTCVGYGAGETCATEQGKPYGYVCFDGAPPGIAGCKLTRASGTLGNNYCCEQNACVEQVDQGAQCNGVAGKPRRFQCPPTDTGNVTPPADCTEHNSGSSDVEKFYCCP